MTEWLLLYFHWSMSSSNCCFLPHIQVSGETGQVVQYFHLFKNLPQFVVMHRVKGLTWSMKEKYIFFGGEGRMPCFPCFLYDHDMLAIWSLGIIQHQLQPYQTPFPVTSAVPLSQPLAAYWPTHDGQWRLKHSTRNSTGTGRAPGMLSSHTVPKGISLLASTWQNAIHWRRQWQIISIFLPWEPHEQYEKAKR